MAQTLPCMNSTGLVSKILDAIKAAKTPDRFSLDYMDTVLGYGSGSARPFIPHSPLYKRNEYAHQLEKKKLEGHVREVTGMRRTTAFSVLS